MNAITRPRAPAAMWTVTLGDRMLFLGSCDRFTEEQALAELRHFQGVFGPAVNLERFDLNEDMIVSEMAIAIHNLSKDGTGVRPQHLEDMGFRAEQVARYFTRAHGLVTRAFAPALKPVAAALAPSNVIAFPGRR